MTRSVRLLLSVLAAILFMGTVLSCRPYRRHIPPPRRVPQASSVQYRAMDIARHAWRVEYSFSREYVQRVPRNRYPFHERSEVEIRMADAMGRRVHLRVPETHVYFAYYMRLVRGEWVRFHYSPMPLGTVPCRFAHDHVVDHLVPQRR